MAETSPTSRQEAFLVVHRAMRALVHAALALAEQLEADPDARDMFDAERAGAAYDYRDMGWDHVFPHLTDLEVAIQDVLVEAIANDPIEEIRIALRHAKESLPQPGQLGGDPRVLAEVVDRLEYYARELYDFCYRQAIAVFGDWGGYWYMQAASGEFSIDAIIDPATVDLPADRILQLMSSPAADESEQAWRDAKEARDRWIYEQVMDQVKYPVIIRQLKSKPIKWVRISNDSSVRKVARDYAARHNRPEPPKRAAGRPRC